MPAAPPAPCYLLPLSGPPLHAIRLSPNPAGPTTLIVGRQTSCEVRLPPSADHVSRTHARLSFQPHERRWTITDLNSRWGTFLNGVKLTPLTDVPLRDGDLLRIPPWTFSFSPTEQPASGLSSFNDLGQTDSVVHTVAQGLEPAPSHPPPLAENLLSLLLETAAAVHAADSESALAERVLDAARRGTGLPNAAWLRPLDNVGTVEVVASHTQRPEGSPEQPAYSRSLLAAAASGAVVELAHSSPTGAGADLGQSIRDLHITTALCVPLMLGAAPAAYLYLDARGPSQPGRRGGSQLSPNASAFCVALGRMASLALSNLKRLDVERRHAAVQTELDAAAEAQRQILPPRTGTLGRFRYTGESRPGRYVGGDFFNLIPLGDARLAVALGDVAGKGIAASVLMTAAHGFLHAALSTDDPACAAPSDLLSRAAVSLNRYILDRAVDQRFVTLWLGLFDLESLTLHYVDAGHGLALLLGEVGATRQLSTGDVPIGVLPNPQYHARSAPLPGSGRALLLSDGITEQQNLADPASRQQFTLAGVQSTLGSVPPGEDEVAALFAATVRHAASPILSDDATAVLLRWGNGDSATA
jgi:serine phosphatase RsbU (regulator of sigma subunit)